jgi:hypothetical protein
MSPWTTFKGHIKDHPGLGAFYGALIVATVTVTLFVLSPKQGSQSDNLDKTLAAGRSTINKSGSPSSLRDSPGWAVQLRTASFPGGKMVLDPGVVGAYTEAGSVFAEETFVKQFLGPSSSKGLRQNIAGAAYAKFVAITSGTYQLGARIEAPFDNITCYGTLLFNGTVLNESVVNGTSTVVKVSPVELSPGHYDVNFVFGCEASYMNFIIKNSAPALVGTATILVMHPSEFAPTPARPDDFVRTLKELPPNVR